MSGQKVSSAALSCDGIPMSRRSKDGDFPFSALQLVLGKIDRYGADCRIWLPGVCLPLSTGRESLAPANDHKSEVEWVVIFMPTRFLAAPEHPLSPIATSPKATPKGPRAVEPDGSIDSPP